LPRLTVVGDGDGAVGMARQGARSAVAVRKPWRGAPQDVRVSLKNGTLHHAVIGKQALESDHAAGSEGTGIIAGGPCARCSK